MDEKGREEEERRRMEKKGRGQRECFSTRLGRVELWEGEVQEVSKDMSKRIRR